MQDLTYIREQMLALCNLVTQPRYEAVVSQSCALISEALQARLSVLFLLDRTGQNFVTGAGLLVGNTNWAPPVLTVPIADQTIGQCPLRQVAITGQTVCQIYGAGGYRLDHLQVLFTEISTGTKVCFLPLHNPSGDLIGIFVVADGEGVATGLETPDLSLALSAIGAMIELRRKEKVEAQHRVSLEQSLSRADKDRGALRTRMQNDLAIRLPGSSHSMQKLRERLATLANFNDPILIEGEDGLGKEQIARELHKISAKSNTPFVYINCHSLTPDTFAPELFGHKRGAIQGVSGARKGLLREAGEGVVYFDRVDALSPEAQGLLARLLDTKRYRPLGSERESPLNQRVIFSAVPGLRERAENGSFLPSLYHKIAQAQLMVTPLRERREDIPDIAAQAAEFEAQARKKRIGFQSDTLNYLMGLHFSGNARELEAMVRRACHKLPDDGQLQIQSFQDDEAGTTTKPNGHSLKHSVESFEAMIIRKSLEVNENNRSLAAKELGIPKRTLADKCIRYGL